MSRRHSNEWIARRAVQIAFLLVLLFLWYMATHRWGVIGILLPKPDDVWREVLRELRLLRFLDDLKITVFEFLIAFAISAVCGTLIGYLLSRSSFLIRIFDPLFSGIYSIPAILFLPLYLLFFGLGPESKIAMGITISFFPIVLNTMAGFGNIEPIYVTSARAMGASGYQMFRWVLLPAAFPVIMTGLRMGFILSFLAVLGSEAIASYAGLGHRIVTLAEGMDTARMYAYVALAVGIAVMLNGIVFIVEARRRRP